MLNGYGFDVHLHINPDNNLSVFTDDEASLTPEDADDLYKEQIKSTKVYQNDLSKSFYNTIGKTAADFFKIKTVHVKDLKIIKDPVNIHHNVYYINFINIDMMILEYLKSGVIDYIIFRVGSKPDQKMANANKGSGENSYDMMRLYLKPIKIDTPKTDNKKVTDITLQCVSLTTYAMLYDKSFLGEIDGGINQDSISITGATDVSVASTQEEKNFKPIENFNSLHEIFSEVSAKTGVPVNILQGFAVIESGMDPNSGNATSSAKGLYQFVDKTWKGMLKTYGAKYGLSSNASVYDPTANTYMAAELLKNNSRVLEDLKQESSLGNLYLAHFLGENDLRKIMNANPNTPAADLLRRNNSDGTVHDPGESNRSIFYKNGRPITAGELISWAKKLVDVKIGSYAPLDIDNESFGYGSLDLPENSGMTITTRLESFKNITGKNFLKQVLSKLFIKYRVNNLLFNDAIHPKSDYIYPLITVPSLNVIRFLEYCHDQYPPYLISVPWILDDAHTNRDDTNITNLGNTYYKEINILNLSTLKPRNLFSDAKLPSNKIFYNITDAIRYYPKEIAQYYKSSSFTFTDPVGVVTNFKPYNSGSMMLIPKDDGSGNITLGTVNIDSSDNIAIVGNFDSVEFNKRREYLFRHIDADPSLLKVVIYGDYPAYIDFGFAYLLYSDASKTLIGTPFKIIQKFEHKENGLVLTTETIMYVSKDVE